MSKIPIIYRIAAAIANNVTPPTMGKWIKIALDFKYIN
jgi:hypothetical protein